MPNYGWKWKLHPQLFDIGLKETKPSSLPHILNLGVFETRTKKGDWTKSTEIGTYMAVPTDWFEKKMNIYIYITYINTYHIGAWSCMDPFH